MNFPWLDVFVVLIVFLKNDSKMRKKELLLNVVLWFLSFTAFV